MEAYRSKDAKKIEEAYIHAAEVPFDTLRYAVYGMRGLKKMYGRYNPNCQSDYLSAAHNLIAGGECALKNINVNMEYISDEQTLEVLREAEPMMAEARSIMEELSGTDNRIDT